MRIGPLVGATLVVTDLERARAGFALAGLLGSGLAPLTRERALAMGRADLVGAAGAVLGLEGEEPWLCVFAGAAGPVADSLPSPGWHGLGMPLGDEAWHRWQSVLAGTASPEWAPDFHLLRSASGQRSAWLAVPDAVAARAFYLGLGFAHVRKDTAGQAQALAGEGQLHVLERPGAFVVDRRPGLQLLTFARVDAQGLHLHTGAPRIVGGVVGERLELV